MAAKKMQFGAALTEAQCPDNSNGFNLFFHLSDLIQNTLWSTELSGMVARGQG